MITDHNKRWGRQVG